MKTKQGFSTLLTVLVTAVVVGVLTGVISYSYAISKKDLEIKDLKEQLAQAKEEAVAGKNITTTPSSSVINETTNWKTYKNERFELRYPNDWQIVSESEHKDNTRKRDDEYYIKYELTMRDDSEGSFALSVPTRAIGFEMWDFSDEPNKIVSEGKIVFNREIGKPKLTPPSSDTFLYLAISDEEGKSAMFIGGSKNFTDDLIKTLDQILSTFQFTE